MQFLLNRMWSALVSFTDHLFKEVTKLPNQTLRGAYANNITKRSLTFAFSDTHETPHGSLLHLLRHLTLTPPISFPTAVYLNVTAFAVSLWEQWLFLLFLYCHYQSLFLHQNLLPKHSTFSNLKYSLWQQNSPESQPKRFQKKAKIRNCFKRTP